MKNNKQRLNFKLGLSYFLLILLFVILLFIM